MKYENVHMVNNYSLRKNKPLYFIKMMWIILFSICFEPLKHRLHQLADDVKMAGRWDAFQGLPHGWEVRFDGRTGR